VHDEAGSTLQRRTRGPEDLGDLDLASNEGRRGPRIRAPTGKPTA
jgi:hypothetical protein